MKAAAANRNYEPLALAGSGAGVGRPLIETHEQSRERAPLEPKRASARETPALLRTHVKALFTP